jgi:hypothetical protein
MCAALHLSDDDLVAVLAAYFDESYNHRTPKNPGDPLVFTVACWLAPVQEWKQFGRKWESTLKTAGLSEGFHMNEYENRRGEYSDWSNLKRVGYLKTLHRIMKDHVLFGCSFSADREAFDEVITPDVRRAFVAKTCYGFGVFSCLDELSGWCSNNGYEDETIHCVFAHMKGQGGDLDAIFNYALKRPEVKKALKLNGMWTKGMASDVPQLQAADIVAYEVNKRIVNAFGGGEQFIRKSLENLHLGYGNRFYAGYYSRGQMRQMVSDWRQGKLRSMVTDLAASETAGPRASVPK